MPIRGGDGCGIARGNLAGHEAAGRRVDAHVPPPGRQLHRRENVVDASGLGSETIGQLTRHRDGKMRGLRCFRQQLPQLERQMIRVLPQVKRTMRGLFCSWARPR